MPRTWSLLVAVAAVAAVVLLFTVGPAGGTDEGGPLTGAECCQGASWAVGPGHAITFSHIELVNSGSDPALIERVELLDTGPGLRLRGAFAGEHEGDSYLAGYDDFPPDPEEYADYGIDEVLPLAGYTVPPQPGVRYGQVGAHGTQVFIGLEPIYSKGRAVFDSVRIRYRVGLRRFVLTIPYAGEFCAPSEEQECIGNVSGG